MKTILLVHGANLNLLGKRDVAHYGVLTLKKLQSLLQYRAKTIGFKVKAFQSNHEGALIDFLQKQSPKASGIIINPGAFTHYSYALHDALLDANLPVVEVHLSKVDKREAWRKASVTAPACKKVIGGKKIKGYFEALDFLRKTV